MIMSWYDDHIEYGEDIQRPYVKSNGLEVHKIMKQIDDDGMIPQEVVQNHYDLNEFLNSVEEGEIDSEITVSSSESFSLSEFNVEHVEAAIDFTRDNSELIDNIKEEQKQLTEAMLQPAEDAHKSVQELELEYFDVDSSLSYDDDGTPVVDFEHQDNYS